MSMRDVEEGLASGVLCWVVVGEVSLLVDRVVARLVAWGKERCGPPQFNLTTVHASETGAARALATARTLPMMADLRVVVLKELEQADEAMFEALAGYLKEPSPSTLLVATGSGFPKARKGGSNWGVRIPKALATQGRLIKIAAGAVAPITFARHHAKTLGKELGDREASLLVEIVGTDLSVLAHEIEKLALFVGDQPHIDEEALHRACSLLAEPVVWDLTTGIAARRPDQAIAALHRLLEDGDSSHRLLALVVWQLRQVLQVAEAAAASSGRPDKWAIAKAAKMRADQVEPILRAIGSNPPAAAALLEKLASANRRMNSHRAGDRRILEALVLELCG